GIKNSRRLYGLHAAPRILCDLIRPGSVVVDAGANAGLYTYWFSKRASIVYAFEPLPDLAAYLRRAVPRNVRVVESALSDLPGMADLYVPMNSGEASLSTVKPHADVIRVNTSTLDSYGLVDVGFIKI